MAFNGTQTRLEDTESSLEKIKRQLTSASGRNILQGPLYKRSETLRKWNERWVILDPTTGKMEYNAAQLVLKAHKEAVNSLGGNSSSNLGTVATVVAAANSTAAEASKQIESAMKISMRAALGKLAVNPNEAQLDDLSIMKETLRVKDEELQHLSRELRARDFTIKDLAEKLTDTAEAAESAASAARTMDEERRLAFAEVKRLSSEVDKLKEVEATAARLSKEVEALLKQRDSALQEAQLWRSELGKARESAVILEAASVRAEERARVAESKLRTLELAFAKEKEELLSYVALLQSQIQRAEHVDLEGDVDKACLNSGQRSTADSGGEWGDLQSANQRIDDVKEISADGEDSSSHNIPVVGPSISNQDTKSGPSIQP